ncbi:SLC13 family permease [Chloroflexota bacterium]
MLGLSQILAIVIFLAMFVTIVSGKIHRYIAALVGGVLVILIVFLAVMRSPEAVATVMNLGQLTHFTFWVPGEEHIESAGVNWQTIIFIGGMMIMVEGMAEAGFFRWLCLYVAKLVNYKPILILVTFMLLSGFLSMFIDSITVLLFLSVVTIELARMLKFDPVPIIVAEIFAANVGGSATMSGDPPNIIIGTAFGYTFMDFATNTGPIAWIGMIVTLVYFWFIFRKTLAPSQPEDAKARESYPLPSEAITNPGLFRVNTGIFVIVVGLIVTHAETGLSMALIGVIAAILAMIAATKKAHHLVMRVDWQTLLFFIGLFVTVGGLEVTHVLKIIAEFIGQISGGDILLVIPIIIWISAFASAIVDNIPFAATMIPIIKELSITHGLSLHTLSWTLALGTDIGGNATPIGASANVVGTAIAEKEGYPISWGRFMKYAFFPMLVVVAMCWAYLVMRYA